MGSPVRQVYPEESPLQRRLVAIMAADVVGYSRFMGADEDGTALRLRQLQQDLVAPAVAAEQGRIFKLLGDAVLAEFPSAVGAVRCALSVQAALAAHEAGRPAAERLRLRIGVHSGDVLRQGEDLIGDGVNVAARLEGVAEPGGVAVSAAVADAVRGKGNFGLVDGGEKALKNIDRPVRVFRVVPGGAAPATAARRTRPLLLALALSALMLGGAGTWWWRSARPEASPVATAPALGIPRLSFVVLPFANRSGDAEQDYFVDGLTESLTNDLSRLEGSFVISRGSAFTYKGRAVDVRQVGRELGVRYVVEGSVLRAGDRVRVTAELVEAETGRQLWTDSFDGDRRDMLEMVDIATARLGRALGVQAIEQESQRAQRVRSTEAADLALRGWAAVNRGPTRANIAEAEAYFRRAQALEPDSISAASGLARTLVVRLTANWAEDRPAVAALVRQQLDIVFRREPENAMARLAECQLLQQTDRHAEAIVACQRAISSSPSYIPSYSTQAVNYNFYGEPEKGLPLIDNVLRLSPRDPNTSTIIYNRGLLYFTMGRYEEAAADFEQSLAINPDNQQANMLLAALYAMSGRQADASRKLAEYMRTAPQTTVLGIRRFIFGNSSNPRYRQSREYLFEGLRRAGMPEG
jgi:class 3 adenylate cyclase/TolB-like protein/cytochrome c-type biogenesis protein CcmH/NrfG